MRLNDRCLICYSSDVLEKVKSSFLETAKPFLTSVFTAIIHRDLRKKILSILEEFKTIEAEENRQLTLSLPKANLTKPRKLLNPALSNET